MSVFVSGMEGGEGDGVIIPTLASEREEVLETSRIFIMLWT